MGLILDSSVVVAAERKGHTVRQILINDWFVGFAVEDWDQAHSARE